MSKSWAENRSSGRVLHSDGGGSGVEEVDLVSGMLVNDPEAGVLLGVCSYV